VASLADVQPSDKVLKEDIAAGAHACEQTGHSRTPTDMHAALVYGTIAGPSVLQAHITVVLD
jgi:hypothetical protein